MKFALLAVVVAKFCTAIKVQRQAFSLMDLYIFDITDKLWPFYMKNLTL